MWFNIYKLFTREFSCKKNELILYWYVFKKKKRTKLKERKKSEIECRFFLRLNMIFYRYIINNCLQKFSCKKSKLMLYWYIVFRRKKRTKLKEKKKSEIECRFSLRLHIIFDQVVRRDETSRREIGKGRKIGKKRNLIFISLRRDEIWKSGFVSFQFSSLRFCASSSMIKTIW